MMHVELEHAEQTSGNTCDICERSFETAEHLLEHIETCHDSAYFNCDSCDYKCMSKSHLNDHIVGCHSTSMQSTESTQTRASLTASSDASAAASTPPSSVSQANML